MLLQRPKVQTWTGLKGCDGILRELCRNLKEQHIEEWTKSSSQQHQAFIGHYTVKQIIIKPHINILTVWIQAHFFRLNSFPLTCFWPSLVGREKSSTDVPSSNQKALLAPVLVSTTSSMFFPPLQLNSRSLNAVFSFFNWEVTVWHHKTFTNQTSYAQKPQNHLIQYWHKTLLNWFSKNIFYSFIVLLFFYCNDASLQYILSQLKAGLFPVC